jgi:hypothetical protein
VSEEGFPYATARAFGAAITDRLKSLAERSSYSVPQLRRQLAYDRLLARLFVDQSQQWILQGGVSLIARLPVARNTADVDLVGGAESTDAALAGLRQAAARDLGDFFSFRFEAPRPLTQGVQGLRIPTEARLGPRVFERFGVDLVTGAVLTGRAEEVEPLSLAFPGMVKPKYRLYPLADSIADIVMAMIERHQGRPSVRYRDLVDLVLIAHHDPVQSDELTRAFESARLHRGLPAVAELVVPEQSLWQAGYAVIANDVPGLAERSLEKALPLAKSLVDPVLAGRVRGVTWNPRNLTWQ